MTFENIDYLKAINLFGLNVSTYKPALLRCIINFSRKGQINIDWGDLSEEFFNIYYDRITKRNLPQLFQYGRISKVERIIKKYQIGKINKDRAISEISDECFNDVVPRFHTIGMNSKIAKDFFYEFNFGKNIILKDSFNSLIEISYDEIIQDTECRWSTLEAAFKKNQSDYNHDLVNNIREVYLQSGYGRTNITSTKPFLLPFQGDVCFYCGTVMGDSAVDHVLPREVLCHDEIWNLVVAHSHCNGQKLDYVVGPHFIEKLIVRNENIMGSNHPWKQKISQQLGKTPQKRKENLKKHYENVKIVKGNRFWQGDESYNPEKDPLYKKLITILNGYK